MTRPTLEKWLLGEADGEPIEGVVLGTRYSRYYGEPNDPTPQGQLLSWAEAQPHLRYSFSSGYGAPDCHAVVAWTKSWVISVSQYDGSTAPFRVPRHPTAFTPDMPGG